MTLTAQVPAVRTGYGQDYHAFMTCDAGDGWIAAAQAQLGVWLRKKQFDPDLCLDGRYAQGPNRLSVAHHSSSGTHNMRAHLTQVNELGTWTTELLLHDRRGSDDWLSLTVANDQGRFVDVPNLARYLMQALPLSDGNIEFRDEARVITAAHVDELIDLLCDPDRHGLVLAAGTTDTDGIDFGTFRAQVERWTKQVYGLAQVVILDPQATSALRREIGPDHAVPGWAIRTYRPSLDPASALDARRHRILGTARLADSSEGRIRILLGQIARAHAATRTASGDAVRVRRAFQRIENAALLEQLTTPVLPRRAIPHPETTDAASPALASAGKDVPQTAGQILVDGVEEYVAKLDLVKAVLGVDVIDAESLQRIADLATAPRADTQAVDTATERMRYLQGMVESLEDQLQQASTALDDSQLDAAELLQEWHDSQARVRWLQTQLAQRGDYQTAYASPPADQATDCPTSFADLLARLDESDLLVQFTGDRDTAYGVDANDTLSSAVQTCWEACLALHDYADAKASGHLTGSIEDYLRNTPPGRHGFPPGKHAPVETAVTMRQYGRTRVFPVPLDVCGDGSISMPAHVKLARIGMVSPRMHYCDDTARTGKIYIGYIGPHLPNTQTC